MVSNPPALDRFLTTSERFFWLLDLAFCTNHIETAEVEGDLAEEDLRDALDRVGRRHPVLGSRFSISKRGRIRFEPVKAPETRIALDEFPCEGRMQDTMPAVLEPFPSGSHPLVRLIWTRREDGKSMLGLIPHHVVADGVSGMALLREIVEAAAGLDGGASPHPALPGLEAMVPPPFRGPLSAWRPPLLAARDAFLWIRHGRPRRIPGFERAEALRRNIRSLPVSLDPEGSASLLDRARWERTTLNGALSAAALMALRAEFPGRRGVALGVRTPVDLRGRLDRPVGAGDLGNFIGVLLTVHRVRRDADFWALARSVRGDLQKRIQRGDAFGVWRNLPPSFLLPPTPRGARRAESLFALQPPAVLISNLGAVPDIPVQSPFRVNATSFLIPPLPRDPLSLSASSFRGKLSVHVAHAPASLPEDNADRIHARFREILCSASAL
ncbi:MAG: phthiocerol/phthiodiolone dimycocerosyl transferase family protein [Planctomycetota bacterium]|jgi:hypothetical protein